MFNVQMTLSAFCMGLALVKYSMLKYIQILQRLGIVLHRECALSLHFQSYLVHIPPHT